MTVNNKRNGLKRFHHDIDLERIVEGEGKLHLKGGNKYDISFIIAKRGEEKLLFYVVSNSINIVVHSIH